MIHAPTNQLEISYNITVNPSLLEDSKAVLLDTIQKFWKKFRQGTNHGLVYCQNKEDVDTGGKG
jgi:hypothetical protein